MAARLILNKNERMVDCPRCKCVFVYDQQEVLKKKPDTKNRVLPDLHLTVSCPGCNEDLPESCLRDVLLLTSTPIFCR